MLCCGSSVAGADDEVSLKDVGPQINPFFRVLLARMLVVDSLWGAVDIAGFQTSLS